MATFTRLKGIPLTFLLFFISQIIIGQDVNWRDMRDNPGATFYDVKNDFEEYWERRQVTRGSGFKPFKRWEAYMKPRVYPSGDMSLPNQTYPNFIQWKKRSKHNFEKLRSSSGSWTELGPIGSPSGPVPYSRTGAGRLNYVQIDPTSSSIIYVGAPDGGLWKSTDSGNSWSTNTDYITVIGSSGIAIDPNDTDILYLATGDREGNKNSIGVLKSTDGGASWFPTGANWPVSNFWQISQLIMNPNNSLNMLISTNVGIFRTTDGWVTSDFVQDGSFKDMVFKPTDPNTIYAGGTELWKSTDNGLNWVQITSGLPTTNVGRIALGVSPADPTYVYALIAKESNSSMLGVYRSTNSGTSFSVTLNSSVINLLGYEEDGSDLTSGQGFYDLAITVSPLDADEVITGGINHWRSSDGGFTWTNTSVWDSGEVHADIHYLYYHPDPDSSNIVYSCNDGGFFKSYDSGNQWIDMSNNLAIGQVVKLGLSGLVESTIVAGKQDNGTNLKTGSSWENIFGGDGGECFIDFTNDNIIYIQYVLGDFNRSDDGGASTTAIQTGLPGGFDFYSTWKMNPIDPNIIYTGGIPTLYKSTNKGDNWTELGTPPGFGTILDIAVAPSDTATIYIIKEDAVSKSTDSGDSFTDVTENLPVSLAALTSVIVSDTDADKAWVTFSGYEDGEKVYKTIDGGSTWTNISAGLPNLPINTSVYTNGSADDAVYVGADLGVYYIDNDTTFIPFFDNLPHCSVRDLEIFYPTSKIRVGTYGRGVWESDLYTPSTGCTITVLNTNDGGAGSLRGAILCASEGDSIRIDPSLTDGMGNDTILLTLGPIMIDKDIKIHQTDLTYINIKAVGSTGPIFDINVDNTLSLKNIDLFSGTNSTNRAILNNGTLILENVYIHEKAINASNGTALTNLGNVEILENVEVIIDP